MGVRKGYSAIKFRYVYLNGCRNISERPTNWGDDGGWCFVGENLSHNVWVCVCVCDREKERKRER